MTRDSSLSLRSRLKNRLRPVKHRVWPHLSRIKGKLINALVRTRHLFSSVTGPRVPGRGPAGPARRFGQGLVTVVSNNRLWWWNVTHAHFLVVVVSHAEALGSDFPAWANTMRRMLGCVYAFHLTGDATTPYEHLAKAQWRGDPRHLRRWLLQQFAKNNVLLIDGREPLPAAASLLAAKYGAYALRDHADVGIAAPARVDHEGRRIIGTDFERATGSWRRTALDDVVDYGQADIPRYTLTDQSHGLWLNADFVRNVPLDGSDGDWDELLARWMREGWRRGYRSFVYPGEPVVSTLSPLPSAELGDAWQGARSVVGPDGRLRVIFVLPATTLSGGIRAVLELAEGLAKRGLDVEVWSLQGPPSWTTVDIPIVAFATYDALTAALAQEDAIKVATWWETGEAVWLGSVERGIPVNYVQEFETWFYPDDAVGAAAVVASYRHEFAYITTADYQRQELEEIGIRAALIPPAFDEAVFRVREDLERRDDTLLAVGRSFFQKNFGLTVAGWRALGDRRPQLELFGFEPTIVVDPRVTYHVLPTDEQIAEMYATATAFIQTSLHEGFSLPTIEAMASGCPVITTDSHGNGFCIDEVNCLMVEQGDVDSVSRAIDRLMADPALRDRLRAAGLETAAGYTLSVILDRTVEAYRSIAADGGRIPA